MKSAIGETETDGARRATYFNRRRWNTAANSQNTELDSTAETTHSSLEAPSPDIRLDDGFKYNTQTDTPLQQSSPRIQVRGKFFARGTESFQIKGVTYGTFKPDTEGNLYPSPGQVERDFSAIKTAGFNTIRIYTVPPVWVLEIAERHSLYLIVGLTWEQHIVKFTKRREASRIAASIRQQVLSCHNHPAILAYTLGNEIPSSIVRWHGANDVQNFLKRLFRVVKKIAPDTLVTYVNYPPTEYLNLSFLDFISFNVYLESEQTLRSYLSRLHNIAEDKPLVMAEIGLDSLRNGVSAQSDTLRWQLDICNRAGLAGQIVFAWTDEWYRGGMNIEDWHFGLVDKDRNAKPALASVSDVFKTPITSHLDCWPRITVAICTYNGSKTLSETLNVLNEIDYPDFEVLVVNDGSTDNTEIIASHYPCKVISTENRGLSSARNTAWQNASGDIVAYLDDDAYPDPDWLYRLAVGFSDAQAGAVGGPNLLPPGSSDVAFCVSHSPGGPNHVLESDTVAEHIPGCNMAIRRELLEELGGFDPQYRAAGDDVDMCWRIRDANRIIIFSPAAVVFHHRRATISGYWKQQRGYGLAEALLAKKYPDRINAIGHLSWAGVIYGKGMRQTMGASKKKIDHGVWGTGFFQSVYAQPMNDLPSLLLLPEVILATIALLMVGTLGIFWSPLYFAGVLGLLLTVLEVAQGIADTRRNLAYFNFRNSSYKKRKCRLVTLLLHVTQPVVRLRGRMLGGLTPLRQRPIITTSSISTKGKHSLMRAIEFISSLVNQWTIPTKSTASLWSENYTTPDQLLRNLSDRLVRSGLRVDIGSRTDRWDLQVTEGCYRKVRLLMAMEEHGGEKQMFHFKLTPYIPRFTAALLITLAAAIYGAAIANAWPAVAALTAPILIVIMLVARDCKTTVIEQLQTLANDTDAILTSHEKPVKTGRKTTPEISSQEARHGVPLEQ